MQLLSLFSVMHSDCRQIAHRLLVLYSFLHVNFSHSLQGLLEIGLAFNHGLQFQGKHFWQVEWRKSGLHYTTSRKKSLLREEQMQPDHWCGSWSQIYKWAEVCRSQRVPLIDSVWFTCIFCSFTMTVTESGWLLFQSSSEKLNEGEEKELK